jgi:hypothetical protein
LGFKNFCLLPGLSATSCVHPVSISKLPPCTPPTTSSIHSVSYLIFPPVLSTISYMHLASISTTGFPTLVPRTHFLNLISSMWDQHMGSPPPGLIKTFAFILLQYLDCPPGASQQLPAFMRFQYLSFSPCLSTTSCMHLRVGSISRPPPSLSNFLRSSRSSSFGI